MKRNKSIMLFVAFIFFGLLLALQFRTTLFNKLKKAEISISPDTLIEQIEDLQLNVRRLNEEIEIETERKNAIERAIIEQQEDLSLREKYLLIQREKEETQFKAGLIDVIGPGITITLDDAEARINEDPRTLVIHDYDIKVILNELKIAGAQAMSINGERILSTSEQVCAGPTILINKHRYATPYVINVIGEPDKLMKLMDNSERVQAMQRDKIRVNIKTSQEILVPGFKPGAKRLEALISKLEAVKE